MNNERKFYVYIDWRLDINEPFNIGKGCENRWKCLSGRNEHFKNIVDKYSIAVEIVKDNLTEDEALYWEEEIIRTLVFDYGYSIDIANNRSIDETHHHLVNATWGGEGTSGYTPNREIRDRMSASHKGKNNHMYGKHHSEETIKKQSKARKGKCVGKNHYMYGKKNEIISNINKSRVGENNPRARKVICIPTNEIFPTIEEASDKYEISPSNIRSCCNKDTKYAGRSNHKYLIWRYYDEYEKYTEKDFEELKQLRKELTRGIICIPTKRIFDNTEEGAKYYNLKGSDITYCCNGYKIKKGKKLKVKSAGKLENGTKLVWRYINFFHDKTYRMK